MQAQTVLDQSAGFVDAFRAAVLEGRFHEAEQLLEDLGRHDPQAAARPIYRTMLALGQNRAREVLQGVYGDTPDELRAVCLRSLGDPTWEGLARTLAEDSPDPTVRRAMRVLLGQDE